MILDRRLPVRAKLVVNAAGVWSDRINERFGVKTPRRHVFSKGVFIGVRRRPSHNTALVVPGQTVRDYFSLIPWGPVSLWGPTDTVTESFEGGSTVQPEDVRFLLEEYKQHFRRPLQDARTVVRAYQQQIETQFDHVVRDSFAHSIDSTRRMRSNAAMEAV